MEIALQILTLIAGFGGLIGAIVPHLRKSKVTLKTAKMSIVIALSGSSEISTADIQKIEKILEDTPANREETRE